MRDRRMATLVVASIAVLAATLRQQAPSDWPAYGRDIGGSRFAPAGDITPSNVITTPLGRVISLDPETGAERWVFDARVDRSVTYGDYTSRGVSTWLDATAPAGAHCRRRIIAPLNDARLLALDAGTGKVCADFGQDGFVDLRVGLRNAPFETAEYELTSPPAIIGNTIVTGSAVADNNRTDAASGEVRAFDARTGRLLWSWDPVPQDTGDPAFHDWRGERAHRTGGANAWSVLAADSSLGLVFVPTGAPSPDYFGGERLGDNRYGNSIVALHVRTGKIAWHFQTVHHDLWELWEKPLGDVAFPDGPVVPGSISLGGPITTASGLTFIGATLDRRVRAFETATGRELWSAELPAGGKATPMTYVARDGRQYVVIAAGGGGLFGAGDAIVAYRLP